MATGQVGLTLPGLGYPEIVEAQLAGQMGLMVTGKERLGPGHHRPLGEPGTVPGVIVGHLVELR